MEWSLTKYAKSGDLHIAYQVLGEATNDLDVLILPYGVTVSIDARDEEPHWNRFERRFASFSRVIRFDPRGLGLSDPFESGANLTIDQWAQDAIAVLDAVGSEQAALFATAAGGLVSLFLCATIPNRFRAQVLFHGFARATWAEDYPVGIPQRALDAFMDDTVFVDVDDETVADDAAILAPTLAQDPEFRAWWARAGRRGAGPSAARTIHTTFFGSDGRGLLPSVTTPTLLLHRSGNEIFRIGHSRYLAEHLADARLVELPGSDHLPFSGDVEPVLSEVEEFLTGTTGGPSGDRVLATVLFSDIAASTPQAVEMGDARWRELLDDHDRVVARQVRRFAGRQIKTTGDGVLATFEGPTQAIRSGMAIRDAARQLGLGVRVGIHTGEVERRGDDVGGIAVHIAARVQAHAEVGSVVVSRVVTDLVGGSGLVFEDLGAFELKGVPGTWQLFEAKG